MLKTGPNTALASMPNLVVLDNVVLYKPMHT